MECKELYTSGEFAKLFKINKKTLEYYRKINIFKPDHYDDNGYSLYSHHQIDTLYIILAFKKLKDIQMFLNSRNPNSVLENLNQSLSDVEKQIEDLNIIKNYLTETISFTNLGLDSVLHLNFKEENQKYLLLQTHTFESSHPKLDSTLFEEATFSPNTSCIRKVRNVKNNSETMYIELYDQNDHDKANFIKEKGLYAQQVHKGPHHLIDLTINNMIDKLTNDRYIINDYIYEEYLIDDLAANISNEYLTLISIKVD